MQCYKSTSFPFPRYFFPPPYSLYLLRPYLELYPYEVSIISLTFSFVDSSTICSSVSLSNYSSVSISLECSTHTFCIHFPLLLSFLRCSLYLLFFSTFLSNLLSIVSLLLRLLQVSLIFMRFSLSFYLIRLAHLNLHSLFLSNRYLLLPYLTLPSCFLGDTCRHFFYIIPFSFLNILLLTVLR